MRQPWGGPSRSSVACVRAESRGDEIADRREIDDGL